jgi:hypothetical protein
MTGNAPFSRSHLRPRAWLGGLLVAYAIYRATVAILSQYPLGLLPAAAAAVVGLLLIRSARARSAEPRSGSGAGPI